jgi:hypothetical protein
MLNRFVIGLVQADFGLKRQRAEAERRERERQEEERKRQEEARRLAEAELRWRDEQRRVERTERLVKMWRRGDSGRSASPDTRRGVRNLSSLQQDVTANRGFLRGLPLSSPSPESPGRRRRAARNGAPLRPSPSSR